MTSVSASFNDFPPHFTHTRHLLQASRGNISRDFAKEELYLEGQYISLGRLGMYLCHVNVTGMWEEISCGQVMLINFDDFSSLLSPPVSNSLFSSNVYKGRSQQRLGQYCLVLGVLCQYKWSVIVVAQKISF